MSKHSKLPPSSAARRVACPGSRKMEAENPRLEDSAEAREGTAAHWLAAWALKPFDHNTGAFPEIAPNGEYITLEMLRGAELYQGHVFSIANDNLHIEERIDISLMHPECWGTPDCWYYDDKNLHIWDYKYGHGYVDAIENWQMIEYVAGIMDLLQITKNIIVHFHIVQPRNYSADGPIRSWMVRLSNLLPYFERLRETEETAMGFNAPCNPSPQCAHCSARHVCPALQRSAMDITQISLLAIPEEWTAKGIGGELRILQYAAKLLDARITGLSEQAMSLIKKGESVPGYGVEESTGRDRWTIPIEEIRAIGELLGHSLIKPPEPITPRQAVIAGIPKEIVKATTEHMRGALKLVQQNASKVFKK